MPSDAAVARERAAKLFALALVGLAVVLVNWDPIVSWLPDVQPGGQVTNETAKQSLVLAASLLLLAAVGALWVWIRGSDPASGFAAVMGSAAVAAVVVFALVLAVAGDNRAWFGLSTLIVVGVATIAALFGRPSFSFANVSGRPLVVVLGAFVLLVGYALVLGFMFVNSGTNVANQWERMIAIFGGVQSIAFAAAGALLGSEVQKGQTAAETNRADENAKIAKGLGAAVKQTAAKSAESAPAAPGVTPGPSVELTPEAVDVLLDQVR